MTLLLRRLPAWLGLFYNKSAFVRVMAWCRTGNKASPTPMMTQFTDTYMCHKALMYKSTRRRKVLVLTANDKQHHGDLPLYRISNTHRKFRKKLT